MRGQNLAAAAVAAKAKNEKNVATIPGQRLPTSNGLLQAAYDAPCPLLLIACRWLAISAEHGVVPHDEFISTGWSSSLCHSSSLSSSLANVSRMPSRPLVGGRRKAYDYEEPATSFSLQELQSLPQAASGRSSLLRDGPHVRECCLQISLYTTRVACGPVSKNFHSISRMSEQAIL